MVYLYLEILGSGNRCMNTCTWFVNYFSSYVSFKELNYCCDYPDSFVDEVCVYIHCILQVGRFAPTFSVFSSVSVATRLPVSYQTKYMVELDVQIPITFGKLPINRCEMITLF